MKRNKVILVTCGKFEKRTTEHIRGSIARVFHIDVDHRECTLDISQFYNPARRQYNADLILEEMIRRAPQGYMKYLNLFRGDLFIPILTYIFGQAQLNGRYGIVSMYRLRNELYGLDEDYNLMLERYTKVVIHELGHMFGLVHCHVPTCVMRSSTYVEDIDQKEDNFCANCRSKLNH